jgi:small subunit ribosomal protein S6
LEVFELDTVAKRLYEGLFLIDAAEAASDWDGVTEMIKRILEKGSAEILSLRKWDERRLAYDIGGKDRGTYILVYFNAPTASIANIERDFRLSERIMRSMIIRGDQITQADMDKETPLMRQQTAPEAVPAAAPAEAAAVKTTDVVTQESQG